MHDSKRAYLVACVFVWALVSCGFQLSNKGLKLLDGTRSLRNVESCFLVFFFCLSLKPDQEGLDSDASQTRGTGVEKGVAS